MARITEPVATGALVLLIGPLVWWQAQRLRVTWSGGGLPWEVSEPRPKSSPVPSAYPEPGPELDPAPPYPLQDPLIELMALPAGLFWMGSDEKRDTDTYDDESPRRRVRVDAFSIAQTPVRRGLYRQLMADRPDSWGAASEDAELPANRVCWEQALLFCNALSECSDLTPCYEQVEHAWVCHWEAIGFRCMRGSVRQLVR